MKGGFYTTQLLKNGYTLTGLARIICSEVRTIYHLTVIDLVKRQEGLYQNKVNSIHNCKMAYSPKAPAPQPNVPKEVTVRLSIFTVYEINVTKWFENFFIVFLGSLTVAHQSHFIT